MSVDLFGEQVETSSDYAKRIVTAGYAQHTYRIRIKHVHFFPYKGVEFDLIDDMGIEVKDMACSGIYAIWEGYPSRDNCLYVGGSTADVRYRLYRFVKELFGVSRSDEGHSAGKKCRFQGVDPHNLYVKILHTENFPEMRDPDVVSKNDRRLECFIDEYIAPILNSRFNKKVRK